MVSHTRLLLLAATTLLLSPVPVLGASDEKTPTATACTAVSTKGGSFFDLRPDIAVSAGTKKKDPHKRGPTEDYSVKGYDYGYNFTLNICESVIQPPEEVIGLDKGQYKNVSAYYTTKSGSIYSIGQQSAVLTPRGSQLVLQYSGGSPCGSSSSSSSGNSKRDSVHPGSNYRYYGDEDESSSSSNRASPYGGGSTSAGKTGTGSGASNGGGGGGGSSSSSGGGSSSGYTSSLDTVHLSKDDSARRKSATFAFRCDRDSVSATAAISFVGADPDECAYYFVVRSQHACAGVQPSKPGSVGPGGVFAIIMIIAIIVYFAGGVFYQRNVANARGWRQLPNYTFWAGIWNFISDFFVIITSSCARFLPSHRGYRTLSISPSGRGMGRSREDEDRLIGQLDEEWDD